MARLAQKHNGVWGGCWCTAFHAKSPEHKGSAEASKAYKKRLVEEDSTHAALVSDGDICRAVIQWLLDSDPAIRWQVMRDLTDAPVETVAAERAKVASAVWAARLLALQGTDGRGADTVWDHGWVSTIENA